MDSPNRNQQLMKLAQPSKSKKKFQPRWTWNKLAKRLRDKHVNTRQQNLISIIIPTLWLPGEKFVCRLLRRLDREKTVGEIILIDNNPSRAPKEIKKIRKLRHLPQSSNQYVNPSWNQGVKKARFKFIALCNDDIIPPSKLFSTALRILIDNPFLPIGVIGTRGNCYTGKKQAEKQTASIHVASKREYGFGSMMFMRRLNYSPIPSWIRINAGDDWLFSDQIRKGNFNMTIGSISIKQKSQKHSISSKREEFHPIRLSDLENHNALTEHFETQGGQSHNSAILSLLKEIKQELKELQSSISAHQHNQKSPRPQISR
jgi:glycosyltransferase involved in cell wall biosynthesis